MMMMMKPVFFCAKIPFGLAGLFAIKKRALEKNGIHLLPLALTIGPLLKMPKGHPIMPNGAPYTDTDSHTMAHILS